MRIAIIGAGPTGLFLGAALARRGHAVTAVDRDAGPAADGGWPRRGVMQFHHAHAFRRQVVQALQAEAPEAYEGWCAAGAEPIRMRRPDGAEALVGMR
jgi:glycine/D-amino acid oxidase-like deaminating enzyme